MLIKLRAAEPTGHVVSAFLCVPSPSHKPPFLNSATRLAAPCLVTRFTLQCPLLLVFVQIDSRGKWSQTSQLVDRKTMIVAQIPVRSYTGRQGEALCPPFVDCYLMFIFKCVNSCFSPYNNSELSQDTCNTDLRLHVPIFFY